MKNVYIESIFRYFSQFFIDSNLWKKSSHKQKNYLDKVGIL